MLKTALTSSNQESLSIALNSRAEPKYPIMISSPEAQFYYLQWFGKVW